jgi:hypothetical protein
MLTLPQYDFYGAMMRRYRALRKRIAMGAVPRDRIAKGAALYPDSGPLEVIMHQAV